MAKICLSTRQRFGFAVALVVVFSLGLLGSSHVSAQPYPTKAIRIIVPFTPGSGTDIVARTVAAALSSNLGQPVIVENRAGAGGTIGAAVVAAAPADGYTLLVQSSSHTVAPLIYEKLAYDTLKDFAAVTPLATIPNVLIISPAKKLTSVRDLIAQATANPGTMNFASAGIGGATHINAEKFRLAARIDIVHVPFKGTPEGVTEVMTGRVDFFFSPIVSVLAPIKDGRLLALAVGTSKRTPLLPDVPTTIELGVSDSDYTFWVGAFAPAKTPPEIVQKLNVELRKVVASAAVSERLASLGAEPMGMGSGEFDSLIRSELKANAVVIKAAKIKAQ